MIRRTAIALLLITTMAHAENGAKAWLRYAAVSKPSTYSSLPSTIVQRGSDPVEQSAARELQRGLSSMLGRQFTISSVPTPDSIVLEKAPHLAVDSFTVSSAPHHVRILAGSERGELYGAFRLLELIAEEKPLPATPLTEAPAAPIRWVNQWDNLDGSIERGYAGRSIFFDKGHVHSDLTRVAEYGRLLASVGLNGCTVNNVNSDLRTLQPEMLQELARVAGALRPWGVRMSLSVDLSSPQVVGHLPTFDPLDPTVIAWWQKTTDDLYKLIPDFAGFVVKADSEGRAGPSQYGRTPAQAANLLAKALQPHHGVVLYRGFVYNHHLDWNDLKADRARAGYDNFHALDGTFEPNVVIQIKHGPIDFQVREPVSPLFSALQHTSQSIELQISQEYTGQQRHMVFLVPMWKAALDTDLRAQNRSTPVKEIVEGKSFHQPLGGLVGVANVGLDENWLHHPMAMANLYGFGKLAWNPNLTTDEIVDGWTRLTFGNNPKVVATIDDLQKNSWHVYEQYTGPLGIGTLTDIISVHFGPGIESAERNGWGQWLRGDSKGIGMDRTVATGTGYIGQYSPELARVYESLASCPDDLLLFMHHVPYTHLLHDGKPLIQSVYDVHYAGAATAATYAARWTQLHGLVDEDRYQQTLRLFEYQAGHAVVWRDAVNEWFQRISGIPDQQGRVAHYPGRIEAESMHPDGYTPINVTPWETGSGGKAMVCERTAACTLSITLHEHAGVYDIAVQYFDLRAGKASYDLLLNDQPIAHWTADDTLPPAVVDTRLDGHTSTRFTARHVSLKTGDTLVLRGTPTEGEPAPVDYIEITP